MHIKILFSVLATNIFIYIHREHVCVCMIFFIFSLLSSVVLSFFVCCCNGILASSNILMFALFTLFFALMHDLCVFHAEICVWFGRVCNFFFSSKLFFRQFYLSNGIYSHDSRCSISECMLFLNWYILYASNCYLNLRIDYSVDFWVLYFILRRLIQI